MTTPTLPRRNSGVRSVLRVWVPPQHGAWAMLVVPFAGGVILGGYTPWHWALLAAWVIGYAATYHAQQYVRLRRVSRRPEASRRHLAPFATFFAVFACLAVVPALAHPWLVVAGACLAPFLIVSTGYAWFNRERSLVNGFIAMVPACAMTVVAYRLGAGDITWPAWAAALAFLLYFAGTVLYVKTMIRERGSRGYWWASGIYHAVCVGLAAVLDPWLTLPFAWYLARAIILPARRLRPAIIGALEVLGSVALLIAIATLR
jgi:hypothetical protein